MSKKYSILALVAVLSVLSGCTMTTGAEAQAQFDEMWKEDSERRCKDKTSDPEAFKACVEERLKK